MEARHRNRRFGRSCVGEPFPRKGWDRDRGSRNSSWGVIGEGHQSSRGFLGEGLHSSRGLGGKTLLRSLLLS